MKGEIVMSSIREAAISEAKKRKADTERSEYESARHQLKWLEDMVGRPLPEAEIVPAQFLWYTPESRPVVEIEGLQFFGQAMIGTCKGCGLQVMSDEIYTLGRIGELIEEFKPSFNHTYSCEAKKLQPVEMRLADCIRELIAEEREQ